MDLHPTSQQEELRQASIDWLQDNMPLADARARPPCAWADMAEMGWFGITAPEKLGGLGLDHATEILIFAELGRYLAPIGAIAAAVAGRWVEAGQATDIIAGQARIALGLRERKNKLRVLDATGASRVLVAEQSQSCLLELPNGTEAIPGLDLSTPQFVLPGTALRSTTTLPATVSQHQQLLVASYELGAAEAARDMAADYAKLREQFGQPIGAFQAIKHLCADMAVRCFAARAQLLYAACALDEGQIGAGFHIAVAKRLATQAAIANTEANIQVHGGIGMTDEARPHLPLKRAHLLRFISPAPISAVLERPAA